MVPTTTPLALMEQSISQPAVKSLIGGKAGLAGKMYPNGETVLWKRRSFRMDPLVKCDRTKETSAAMAAFRLAIECPEVLLKTPGGLGLSTLAIFDRLKKDIVNPRKRVSKVRMAKGQKGISAYGKRMVRNAAYLLEHRAGRARCIFATCTVPPLPREKLRQLHERWHKVVEIYRLKLRRALQDQNLSGENVLVTEIQEKRYEKTGLPVVHIHCVFVGVTRTGRYAISCKHHDDMWAAALRSVIDIGRDEVSSACNLQRVKKSASGYLGKYMSKGAQAVTAAIEEGFSAWMPKHWWSCSRSLSRAVKSETRDISLHADWLERCAQIGGGDVWEWHREVLIELPSGDKIMMARYGRLVVSQIAELKNYYRPSG